MGGILTQPERIRRFRLYDALPRELKVFLQDHIVNLTPEQPYSMWSNGVSIKAIIAGGNNWFRSSEFCTREVYGPSHPEAK